MQNTLLSSVGRQQWCQDAAGITLTELFAILLVQLFARAIKVLPTPGKSTILVISLSADHRFPDARRAKYGAVCSLRETGKIDDNLCLQDSGTIIPASRRDIN